MHTFYREVAFVYERPIGEEDVDQIDVVAEIETATNLPVRDRAFRVIDRNASIVRAVSRRTGHRVKPSDALRRKLVQLALAADADGSGS